MFQKVKMEGKYWAVFLVNKTNPEDRYMLTTTLDKEEWADKFVAEFNRILNA
jgi:hypothetical protein